MTTVWTKQQIRLARKIKLAPILLQRNYRLHPLKNGNFEILPALGAVEGHDDNVTQESGIVIKESFWTWPERNMAGNTIDFFVKIEGRSFNQAMEIITKGRPVAQNFTSSVVSPALTTTAAGTIYDNNAGIAQKSYS